MITFRGFVSTVLTTTNFWDALFMKISDRKKSIVFRNGIKMDLKWEEYRQLRNWLEYLRSEGFTIERVNGARAHAFRIKKNNFSCVVSKLSDDLFSFESDKVRLVGPLDALTVYFFECEIGLYDCDCKDKVVLDVGGYCGETAAFFSSRGAKRVIVYEPVAAHHAFIKRNVALNSVQAEVHEEGIGEQDGTQTIHYQKSAGLSFGILSTGKNEIRVKVRAAANIIEESRADIGKFDCEGAEMSLIKVPKEILRRIDLYIIETHTPKINKAIIEKFSRTGFRLVVRALNKDSTQILHFKKIPKLSGAATCSNVLSPYDAVTMP
jgi:FkbM family methyltransferase